MKHRIPRRSAPLGVRYSRFTRSISFAYANKPTCADNSVPIHIVDSGELDAEHYNEAYSYGRQDRLRAEEYANPYNAAHLRQAYDDGWNSVLPVDTTVTLQ